jgi:hypothetical protein
MKYLKLHGIISEERNWADFLIAEATLKSLTTLFQKEFTDKDYNSLTDAEKKALNDHVENRRKEVEKLVNGITDSKEYQGWIYDIMLRKNINMDEDHDLVKTSLVKFDEYKKDPLFRGSKDIKTYKSQQELNNVLVEFESHKQKHYEGNLNVGNNKIIYDKGIYKIVELLVYKDALILSQHQNWCVKHEHHFNGTYGPPFFCVLKNNKPMALIHFGSLQCKDVDNRRMDSLSKHSNENNKEFYNVVKWLADRQKFEFTFNPRKTKGDFDTIILNNTLDEKGRIALVSANGMDIASLVNPSEAVQVAAMEKNPKCIKYIVNPTEKVKEMDVDGMVNENGDKVTMRELQEDVSEWDMFDKYDFRNYEWPLKYIEDYIKEGYIEALEENSYDNSYEQASEIFSRNRLDIDEYNDEFDELREYVDERRHYNYDEILPDDILFIVKTANFKGYDDFGAEVDDYADLMAPFENALGLEFDEDNEELEGQVDNMKNDFKIVQDAAEGTGIDNETLFQMYKKLQSEGEVRVGIIDSPKPVMRKAEGLSVVALYDGNYECEFRIGKTMIFESGEHEDFFMDAIDTEIGSTLDTEDWTWDFDQNTGRKRR